jgi:hypothetical protein
MEGEQMMAVPLWYLKVQTMADEKLELLEQVEVEAIGTFRVRH